MGKLFKKSFPTPLQKLSHNRYLNRAVSLQIDSRRERKVRFGCRKLAGASKPLLVKRVVLPQHGSTKVRLSFFVYHSTLCILHSQLSHFPLLLSRKTARQKGTRNDRKSIKTSARVRVFVVRLNLFAASVEHFFSLFLTNPIFLCIIGKKDTKKGGDECTKRLYEH